ncbi:hypothetical protein CDAR_511851 [Caerostris darwini]|uniref:Uncharacterized protein n=1 Tax=Caerostris darwini TaxID=1538125 RepID=A0AAV4P3Q3_9ARAC|nr:hypothetical protein CDAR_511851 [Caerostris darwini]
MNSTPSEINGYREKGFLEHHQEEIGQEKMRVVIVERQTFSSGSSPSAGILVSQLNELDTKEKGFLEHHQEEIGQEKMRVVIVERQTFSSADLSPHQWLGILEHHQEEMSEGCYR